MTMFETKFSPMYKKYYAKTRRKSAEIHRNWRAGLYPDLLERQATVKTPDGYGTIVRLEIHLTGVRYGIKLSDNPYTYPIAYYWPEDVQ